MLPIGHNTKKQAFSTSKLIIFTVFLFVYFYSFPKEILAATTNTSIYLPSLEKNLTTGETNKYYSLGSVTLQRSVRNEGGSASETLYYLFPDHLLSTKLIIDKDKTETAFLSYYPYGSTRSTGLVPSSINNLYTNQKQDHETNLYYYHARYYNPQTGHFISADKPYGQSKYTYVNNNPIMMNDPSGNYGLVPSALSSVGIKMTAIDAAKQLDAVYEALGGIGLNEQQQRVIIDPTWSQTKGYLQQVAQQTGLPFEVLAALGFRENGLRGNEPQLHGDPSLPSGDGMFAVAVRAHNLDPNISMWTAMSNWGLQASFVLYHNHQVASNTPGWFIVNDLRGSAWGGATVYLDALEMLTNPDDPLYKLFEPYKDKYSIWALAFVVYNIGPNALKQEAKYNGDISWYFQSTVENTGLNRAALFEDTLKNRSWINYCDPGGYCWNKNPPTFTTSNEREYERYTRKMRRMAGEE